MTVRRITMLAAGVACSVATLAVAMPPSVSASAFTPDAPTLTAPAGQSARFIVRIAPTADAAQVAAALRADGVRVVGAQPTLDTVVVEAGVNALDRLRAVPGVLAVAPDRKLKAAVARLHAVLGGRVDDQRHPDHRREHRLERRRHRQRDRRRADRHRRHAGRRAEGHRQDRGRPGPVLRVPGRPTCSTWTRTATAPTWPRSSAAARSPRAPAPTTPPTPRTSTGWPRTPGCCR